MSGTQPSKHVLLLEKLKEKLSYKKVTLPCVILILSILGQWMLYKFVMAAGRLDLKMNCLFLPLVQVAMETVTCILFISIKSSQEIKDKLEGFIICGVCHMSAVFLSGFLLHIYPKLPLSPFVSLGLILLVIQDRICSGVWERPLKILCILVMTFGTIIVTSHTGHNIRNGHSTIAIGMIFFTNLRNILMKRMTTENVTMVIRHRVMCTYASALMVALFLFGMLGNRHVTAFIMMGLFSAIASVVTTFILFEFILIHTSVFVVAIFQVWSSVLLDAVVVTSHPPSNLLVAGTGAMIMAVATVVYLCCNSDEKETAVPLKLNEYPRVSRNELYTRMEFLVYIGYIIGLVIFFFRPNLSDRDWTNLQNIGIHQVIHD